METKIATAKSCSNIAFIKYWGNRNDGLRLPENGSISMNLAGVETITTVQFDPQLPSDSLILNGQQQTGPTLERVSQHLDNLRRIGRTNERAMVHSKNNFPTGAGIASSASSFAALTVAASHALGLKLSQESLSAVARLGSGSASRSVPGGYVEWYVGDSHDTSFAESIAPADHWELIDLVVIVSKEHKAVGSTGGHSLARTSPLQTARVADTERRLTLCRQAIQEKDFGLLAQIMEQDAVMMHGVMMTSQPALYYWIPATLHLIEAVQHWRADGIPVCFTIDAGPNVHVITLAPYRERLIQVLRSMESVLDVLVATPGGPSELISEHLTGVGVS